MVRGMAAIAERDEIGWFIDPTGSTGDQMMDVGLASGTGVTASLANMGVSCKYNGSDLAPSLVLRLGRVVEPCLRQLGLSRPIGLANATWPVAPELGLFTVVELHNLRRVHLRYPRAVRAMIFRVGHNVQAGANEPPRVCAHRHRAMATLRSTGSTFRYSFKTLSGRFAIPSFRLDPCQIG